MPFNIVTQSDESTVAVEYKGGKSKSSRYQSEEQLEKAFIEMLCSQGYEYLSIHKEEDLILNLRAQLEKLNRFKFTDEEWKRFFSQVIANRDEGIEEKTAKIQEDNIQPFVRDDKSTKNITLINKKDAQENCLQVINQYEAGKEQGAEYDNRYDVTILVNGFPLVHAELKRRGVAIREAFNQIDRYGRESFWSGNGLFDYVQIFVISNGTYTKYYSNTTRSVAANKSGKDKSKELRTNGTFEFTSFWADAENNRITDLEDFTKTFFCRHTLLNILTKYCVFTADKKLMVMRPYQIAAAERIIRKIEISRNTKPFNPEKSGGYVWHTTGSGKTLTSFKAARLATHLPYIDKVLFVVDRKDLDHQTMLEYDRYEKGAANSNTSTKVLERQLSQEGSKIIITTIQKLSIFISRNKRHPVYSKQVVIIFDECHRSQFGAMHSQIRRHFRNRYMFGFTGTPIFAENAPAFQGTTQPASEKDMSALKTTEQTFGERLHVYTIVDAINDENVLPFRVDYIKTMKEKESVQEERVEDINREKAFNSPERIQSVVSYVLSHFEQKTYRRAFKSGQNSAKEEAAAKDRWRKSGFNSIFAASSIESAKLYYAEFKRQLKENPLLPLNTALIYSFAPNEERADADGKGTMPEENSEDPSRLDKSSKDFLNAAIADYNAAFGTEFDVSAEKFQNYYADVSDRVKKREVDLLIVVNMFLTGFDAVNLNTLWVDKNLRYHGLLQAFSRTNRILNSVKTFGNIVCFRDLREEVDESVALFADKNASSLILLRSFEEYYSGYDDKNGKSVPGYKDLAQEIKCRFFPCLPDITGEKDQRDFIALFGSILRLRNVLSSFDEFFEDGKQIFSEREMQNLQSVYLDLRDKWKKRRPEQKDITDDIEFEMELVEQVEINIDYILTLIAKYKADHLKDKELFTAIMDAAGSSPKLRSKKELIKAFIEFLDKEEAEEDSAQKAEAAEKHVSNAWKYFAKAQRDAELSAIISEEHLKKEETLRFVQDAFREGRIKTYGTELAGIFPALSMRGNKRDEKKKAVSEKLLLYLEKYRDLGMDDFSDFNAQDTAILRAAENPAASLDSPRLLSAEAAEPKDKGAGEEAVLYKRRPRSRK